jgi:hypothetical protein
VLARHYGFTEAELDFIIHYGIKYKYCMGRVTESVKTAALDAYRDMAAGKIGGGA